ncbi:homogentisate 1,2-dioxygenase [Herpetosiphon giganteus]|uniref:homogentisate 1,2-dioxygenase n=1 Tax=Herpetosiphon giganteus TaxID=2029754 RepID=UPI0019596E6A|nr:homogentisate 1,2-dioxygenase [Herpetosiphon giganteus]MBM7845549.1 homogentisate 1,2-dioxygenase [Herpetosiphon giganteus]
MPFYHKLGNIPHKRHTQFRKPDGSLYSEQLMGTKGFSGVEALLYHHYPPTAILKVEDLGSTAIELEPDGALRHRHLKTFAHKPGGDPIGGRRMLLVNNDVRMGIVHPTEPQTYFYRNGEGDEMLFIHEGEGVLETIFGNIPYRRGDYLVIPIGTTYRVNTNGTPTKMLVLETVGEITTPNRYRNEHGQLLEHAPFCERDIRVPMELTPHDEKGEFAVHVRAHGRMTKHVLDHHPFDVVGWDGYLYPFAFNIEDFEPITGRVHQPPPVHQTFSGPNFVVCSFVPRMFDYHPEAIPAPYNHSNVESDEVLYYVEGNFMSRRGVDLGSITLHPSGMPHGPHPGTVEGSIGKAATEELAVMVDTFKPLYLTKEALSIEEPSYTYSWVNH